MNLNILVGPIVGSIIGYCTNYIAVKMLFRPLNPVKIGNFTLPFTPGIIPKGKKRLAKALGEAVGTTLLTEEDLEKTLLSERMVNEVSSSFISLINSQIKNVPIKELVLKYVDNSKLDAINNNSADLLTDKIMTNLISLNVGQLIADQGAIAIKEKVQGSFLAMMVNDKLINSLTGPLSEKINSYISENGHEIISPLMIKEINNLENQNVKYFIDKFNLSDTDIEGVIKKLYISLIKDSANSIVKNMNVSEIVENKVNQMDTLEIEKLVMSVMKKELNAVVNLGALIGFILGIINCLF